MKKIKFKNLRLMVFLPLVLSLMSCDRPYLSGPIEIDFHNTTWILEDTPNLGAIYIKEGEQFCIDRPLAEKLYPKGELDHFEKKICGKFKFDTEDRMIHFNLVEYSKGASVLRAYPNGDYFISIVVLGVSDQISEGILIQKRQ